MATFATLISDARKQVGATSSQWSDTDIAIDMNNGIDEATALIQRAVGGWEFEDSNRTDQSIGRTNITSGQQDIGIDLTFLKVEKVWIHTSATDTNWIEIKYGPDKTRFLNKNPTNDVGIPTRFTIIGNSIFFDCFPNYTTTGSGASPETFGVKVLVTRNAKYLGDGNNGTLATTDSPGFNPQFHKYLSLYCQRERLEAKEEGNNHYNKVVSRMLKMEKDIQKFYSSRKKATTFNIGAKNDININDYK